MSAHLPSSGSGLRILHVAEDITAASGGVPAVVRQLSTRAAADGCAVDVLHALGPSDALSPQVHGLSCPPAGLGRYWSWSPGLRRCLQQQMDRRAGLPVVHVHGIWAAPQYLAAREAGLRNLPVLLSAHGMLEPWLWTEQGWKIRLKKSVYWHFMAYPAFHQAKVVHALTRLEHQHLQVLFPDTRVEIIPNAVEVADHAEGDSSAWGRSILFLGRIEPKKGVDILIRAFFRAQLGGDWTLDIAGPSWSADYSRALQQLVVSLGLQDRVRMLGPVFGEQQRLLMAQAWAMALPSHSEGLPLVCLEAGASSLPTITTYQTGLEDWESGGGLLTQPDVDEVAAALAVASCWSHEERRHRGRRSFELVRERYSWQAVWPMWRRLYQSLQR